MDILGISNTPMRVILKILGDKSLVQFRDSRYDEHSIDGQFISEYYVSTILESFDNNKMIDLDLYHGVHDWQVSSSNMKIVVKWIKLFIK